jgi:hypothetical protein
MPGALLRLDVDNQEEPSHPIFEAVCFGLTESERLENSPLF